MFVYSWACDENYNTNRNNDDNTNNTIIRCYGIDENNKSIALVINNFTPYVYIELPKYNRDYILQELLIEISDYTLYTEVMRKKHLYSSHGEADFLFCQCTSRKSINYISHLLKSNKLFKGGVVKLHEEVATSILQMTSLRQIPTATWISFKNGIKVIGNDKTTTADEEYNVKWRDLYPSDITLQVYPKILAFDLEVNSESANAMPSDKCGDVIFQIGCVIQEKQQDKRKILLTLDGTDLLHSSSLLEGIDVKIYENEEELLTGFIKLLHDERPNVLTGYNILMFDISYLMKRCERYSLNVELCGAGWNKIDDAQERKIKWSSSAYRNQEYHFIDWEGILILDLLPIIKRDYKLDNYKLDTVAHNLINAEKDPLNYKDIFAAYKTKTMARVGKYCVQDSNLCIDLLNYIHCWISLAEMSVVCKVPMFNLYTQGQQLKIYSQIYYYCLFENIVVTSNGYACTVGERYRGAYVMDPVPGYYENVVPLDFNSLYPSLIIGHNICYYTFLSEDEMLRYDPSEYETHEWEDHIGCEHDSKNIEISNLTKKIDDIGNKIKKLMIKRDKNRNKEYQKLINKLRSQQKPYREKRAELKKSKPTEWEDEDGNIVSGIMCAKRKYTFLKSTVKRGVIPTIIQNLLDSRKVVKREMKTCTIESDKIVLDKKQLAYKVSANSMYGAMGVRRGYVPFMPGAMCVTYLGRIYIQKAGQIACQKYGAKWIYSDTDSTYLTFPPHLTTTSMEIWDYANHVAEQVSKEFPDAVNIEFEQAIYSKFIILSKKRYMYRTMDRDGKCDNKIGKKGIVLARRDNSGFLKTAYSTVIDMAFNGSDEKSIESFLIDYINDLFRRKIPYSQFVITKSVGSTANDGDDDDCCGDGNGGGVIKGSRIGDYKVKMLPNDNVDRKRVLNGKTERQYAISQCPAQVQLAERMRLRGFPIDVGSRMEFVVIYRGKRYNKLADKCEDYDYFMKRSSQFKIDKLYYLKSLVTPLDQLLGVILHNSKFIAQQLEIRVAYEKNLSELRKLFSPKLIISK